MDENLRLILIAVGGPFVLVCGLYVSGIVLGFVHRLSGGSNQQQSGMRSAATSRETEAQLVKRQLLARREP